MALKVYIETKQKTCWPVNTVTKFGMLCLKNPPLQKFGTCEKQQTKTVTVACLKKSTITKKFNIN